MASFAIVAMDREHTDAVSSSLCVLGIFIPSASLCPFVTTDHAVNRPLHIDAQIRRYLCAYFPVHGGFKEAQQLCPGVSDADRKAEGCCQILREEGHDTRS
jgi:hypothetical protein